MAANGGIESIVPGNCSKCKAMALSPAATMDKDTLVFSLLQANIYSLDPWIIQRVLAFNEMALAEITKYLMECGLTLFTEL